MIDDLEDNNAIIRDADNRTGAWYTYNDTTGTQDPAPGVVFPPTADGANGTSYSARMSGQGFSTWGAGMGFNLNNYSQYHCPYDASRYGGLGFYLKGSGSVRLRVATSATTPVDDGGACESNCYDHFVVDLSLSSTWEWCEVEWSQLAQGTGTDTFDPRDIMSITWLAPSGAAFDVYVDEVQFVGTGTATGGAAGTGGGSTGGSGGSTGGSGGSGDVTCTSNDDCTPPQVCGELRTLGEPMYCIDPAPGGGQIGAGCTSWYTSDECYELLCLDWTLQCTRSCVDDGDCTGAGGFVCVESGNFRFCLDDCQADVQCPSGSVCSVLVNPPFDRNDLVCTEPRGSLQPGDDCSSPQDCENFLCIPHYDAVPQLLGQVCTPACRTGADCPGPFTACGTIRLQRPQGGWQDFNLCLLE